MGYGWTETKARPRTPRQPAVTYEPIRPQTSYLSRAAHVKHAVTVDGFACLEFRVRKLKADGTGKPEEFIIQVL